MESSGLRRTLAQLFTWVGIFLGIAALATWLSSLRVLPPGFWAGGALAALGLGTLLGGDVIAGPEPRPFTARGQVVRGELVARAGPNDLSVGSCGTDRVAAVRHGPYGKPGFIVEDGVAYLRLGMGFPPNITRWEANLARNVLWNLDVRAGLGDLAFDLSRLRVERLVARSRAGRIEITCPARGYTQMFLRTWIGEIEVHIPDHVGARLHIRKGELATLRNENPRLLALDARRYSTPDFDTATTQVEIRIDTAAGDIILT